MNDSTSHNWSTISLIDFDYCVPMNFNSEGLKFDENFNAKDNGQLATELNVIEEEEFVMEIRKEAKEREAWIPTALYDFYDNCKGHIANEYITLLSGYISNVECIKTLKEFNDSDRTMKYFKLELSSEPNFGKAQCLRDAASKFDEEVKSMLNTTSKNLQLKAMLARQKALDEVKQQLKNCIDKFLEFGAAEWVRQCSSLGTAVNTLDQQYAVKPHRQDFKNICDDDGPNECDVEMMNVDTGFDKMSTFLFALAVHDSKPMVNEEIQKKRAIAERARRQADAIKQKQSAVNIAASAAKPAEVLDTFKARFDDLDRLKTRVRTVEEEMPKFQKKAEIQRAQASTSDSESKSEFPKLAEALLSSMNSIQKSVEGLSSHVAKTISNTTESQKNDSGADIDETTLSRKAQQRQHPGRGATATETKAKANHPTKTKLSTANQSTTLGAAASSLNKDPPASTGRNDQGKGKWLQQKQRKIHHSNADDAHGSDHAGKPMTQDGAATAKKGGFGRGRDHGFAPARGLSRE